MVGDCEHSAFELKSIYRKIYPFREELVRFKHRLWLRSKPYHDDGFTQA